MQWYHTLQLGFKLFHFRDHHCPLYNTFGLGVKLGQVASAHRLFLAGDIVFVLPNNGMYQRYPVFAVSSKGYTVTGI